MLTTLAPHLPTPAPSLGILAVSVVASMLQSLLDSKLVITFIPLLVFPIVGSPNMSIDFVL